MRKLNIFLIAFSVFFSINSYCITAVDSILFELRNTPENKERSILLNNVARNFLNSNIDSALNYAEKGYYLAKEIDYSYGIGQNAALMADCYVIYDSLLIARDLYIESSIRFKELQMDHNLADVYMVIGNIFLSQSNYSTALEYYHKSKILCEKNDLETILANLNNNIGIIYISNNQDDKALESYKKAYQGFKNLELPENMAHTLSNIGGLYLRKGQDSIAFEYYKEAQKIFIKNENMIDISFIYNDLGNYEYDKENYIKALEYYNKSLAYINQQKTDYKGPKSKALVPVLLHLGMTYYKLGDNDKAQKLLEKSLGIALQNNYAYAIESNSFELSKLHENNKDFGPALKYYKIYEQYGDSILNKSSIKKITQLEMQYKFDKKIKHLELEETKTEVKNQKKEFIYFLIISIGILIAGVSLVMLFYQRNKTVKVELKRQNLKLEHEKLQQELEHRNKELATNVMYLLSKNEFITTTAEKLTKAKMNFKKENQKIIQDVIRDLLLNSSKDVWKEFEVRFQEVHSDFYENLNNQFPELTPNEKKISAFLRLNMSTKEISTITYQSVRTINMARFRLRKKMSLDNDENLISFLAKF